MQSKQATYNFLKGLESFLISNLPPPSILSNQIAEFVSAAKCSDCNTHLRRTEEAFLNAFAIPLIFEHVSESCNLSYEEVRHGLLSENYRHIPEFSLNTPAYPKSHPLAKSPMTSDKILKKWRGELRPQINPITKPCPDFAFTDPIPYHVVCDGKYFDKDSQPAAARQLVEGFYEVFLYQSLPEQKGIVNRPDWQYDYGCLLAYDSSEKGVLFQAWSEFSSEVRQSFWEASNVYIMILRRQNEELSN